MSHSSAEGPPEKKIHETQQLILQVAQRLFLEQGYRTVSTRQIAAACGLTQPALYRHFATKQELYVAVLLQMLHNLHGRLLRLSERKESMQVRLHLIAQMLPATWIDARQMFHDIEHELDTTHRQDTARAFRQQVIEPIASLFEDGIAQGLLRDPSQGGLEPVEATFVLLRLLDDHGIPLTQNHSRLQHADSMVDVLLHGLLKQTEAS